MNKKDLILSELLNAELSIVSAKTSLDELKNKEQEYIDIRENETKQRINVVLKESENTFNKIENNCTELRSYVERLKEFVRNINTLKENTLKQSEKLKSEIKNGEDILDEKIDILNILKKELDIQERELRMEEKAIYDKRDAFERAWKDLKK